MVSDSPRCTLAQAATFIGDEPVPLRVHVGGAAEEAPGKQTGSPGFGKLLGKPGSALPALGGEAKTGNATAVVGAAASTDAVLEVCAPKQLALIRPSENIVQHTAKRGRESRHA
jgi:hypothetical protein